MSPDFTRPLDQGILWFYGSNLFIVCNHPATFGVRSHCDRDITYLICHVTLQDHLNKGSCDSMELLYVTILLGLVAIDIVNLLRDLTQELIVSLTLPNLVVLGLEVVDDVTYNISRDLARSRDQRASWLYGRTLLIVYPHPAKFDSHGHCGIRDIIFLVCMRSHKTTWLYGHVTLWVEGA